MKKTVLLLTLVAGLSAWAQAEQYTLLSPNQRIEATIEVGDTAIHYQLCHDHIQLVNRSPIGLRLSDGTVIGRQARVLEHRHTTVDTTLVSPLYKRSTVHSHYNELLLACQGNYSVVFRAYDDGLAYRLVLNLPDTVLVQQELMSLNFADDYTAIAPYSNSKAHDTQQQLMNSFESLLHLRAPITKQNASKLMILPLVVELPRDKKMIVTEVDLEDYPGMFITNDTIAPSLRGVMAGAPKVEEQGGHNQLQGLVTERHPYIARVTGPRNLPWRVLAIADRDIDLATSDMVYKLASPSRVADVSWIHPGKVAWEWWNASNLRGVDFATGINNQTYKYYIDFAAHHGIEYVILDEGYSVKGHADLLDIIPQIDLPELVQYAQARKVGIILWAGYWAFNSDMEYTVKHYAKMGVKGFKIDFMDRDDQDMVNFVYEAARVCAEHHMLVDFHGVYKPTGLQRTYPNVLNFEAVYGLEQAKWCPPETDMMQNDATIPYIRMFAGPVDYTQGAMRNSTRQNFRAIRTEPMSQGTRAHQLALYVIFDSPLNMLCDSPTNYEQEAECTEFIAQIPTVWDNTVGLSGTLGEYAVLARQKDNVWYLGAITNWQARDIEIDLSFLPEGSYKALIYQDGTNASKLAIDYKKEERTLTNKDTLVVRMAPGGGVAVQLTRIANTINKNDHEIFMVY